MKTETIPGWNPELEGKLAGERERAARKLARPLRPAKDQDYLDHMGVRADNDGREPPLNFVREASVVANGQRVGRDIADRFVLEVRK